MFRANFKLGGLHVQLALAFAIVAISFNSLFAQSPGESPLKNKIQGSPVHQLQEQFHQIFELYKDSVVFINTEKVVEIANDPFFDHPLFRDFQGPDGSDPHPHKEKRSGLGSGFVISSDGYICTNYHVVADSDSVTVRLKGKEHKARVIGSDELSDIALLKIDGVSNLQPAYFGNSDQVRVGDWAIAIGNPFGLEKTFTVGVISAEARTDIDQPGNSHIQTDASINPGNSGGPLLNINGEVIGVNRMIYSRTGGYMGIGFAIPINSAVKILDELKKNGKIARGFLGVQVAPISPTIATRLGLPATEGSLVGEVLKGSPAEKSGIKKLDVILSIDNNAIKDFRDLLNMVVRMAPGEKAKFSIWRDKKKLDLMVTIGERPGNP